MILPGRASTFIFKNCTPGPAADGATLTREPWPSRRCRAFLRREERERRTVAGDAFMPSPRVDPASSPGTRVWCHVHRRLVSRCVCQSTSSSPSSCAHARCPDTATASTASPPPSEKSCSAACTLWSSAKSSDAVPLSCPSQNLR